MIVVNAEGAGCAGMDTEMGGQLQTCQNRLPFYAERDRPLDPLAQCRLVETGEAGVMQAG